MINPLAPAPAMAVAAGPLPADPSRAVPPDAAVQVTAGQQATDSNTATQGDAGQADGGQAMDPLEKALKLVNDNLQAWSTDMRFDVDPDSGRIVISIIDHGSGKVLRTVPSDAVLRVAKMITKMQGSGVNTEA